MRGLLVWLAFRDIPLLKNFITVRELKYIVLSEMTKTSVVIKLLKNTHPSFQELLQFRNQYNIAKNINFPGIIQTYSLDNYQNGYALVMEDMGGISLKEYFPNLDILSISSL